MLQVDLSMGEHTRFGRALMSFWYGGFSDDMKGLVLTMSGYPHNGGRHTLTISDHTPEVLGWLELFEEQYPFVKEELDILREYIKENPTGRAVLYPLLLKKEPRYTWTWNKNEKRGSKFINPEGQGEWLDSANAQKKALQAPELDSGPPVIDEQDVSALVNNLKSNGRGE